MGFIIGIHGQAGAGKDTLLKFINEELGAREVTIERGKLKNSFYNPFERQAFADKLKQVCSVITDLPLGWFYDREKYTYIIPYLNLTIRELMQKVGEGLREKVCGNIWLLPFHRKFTSAQNWVFVDIRHLNELEFVKQKKGLTIKIIRPNHEDSTLTTEETKNHPSETALSGIPDSTFDLVLVNTSLESVKLHAKKVIELYDTHCKKLISEPSTDF